MTTKTTPAVETITVQASPKPYFLRLIGPTVPTLQEACVHIRAGYVFSSEPIEFFGPTGTCAFTLQLGQPEPYMVEKAAQAIAVATEQELANHKRAVAEEAKRLVEMEKRAELEQKVKDAVAASEQAIAKIKKEVAAELAKLN